MSPSLEIVLDKSLYHLEAIQAACYKFSDKFSVLISEADGHYQLAVTVTGSQADSLINFEPTFKNELLDQELRLSLEQRFGQIREQIYRFAFSPLDAEPVKKKL
jgi:His-Xaa-Ser system protein HxsD